MTGKIVIRIAAVCVFLLCAETSFAAPPGKTIWIYTNHPEPGAEETRSEVELKFAPYGFMPGERADQIAVNAEHVQDPEDRRKGTCIEYSFKFSRLDDWQGVYTLIGGDAWGTKPGINVQQLLGVFRDAVVNLRFMARGANGGETVTFQCGGVATGSHRSSLAMKRVVQPDPVRLTAEFKEYSIPLVAGQLTNVVDPFCVAATARDNRGADAITIYVDEIRFEGPVRKDGSDQHSMDWRQQLKDTLFIAYTPTGFDPTKDPAIVPTESNIKNDLQALRSLADANGLSGRRTGIITYGSRDGLELIPNIARQYELSVILGVFNPLDEVEIANASELLRSEDLRSTIVACCIGNEAITFRRCTLDDIVQVAKRLRVRPIPVTTTEVVDMYGDERLFQFDFSFPNVHAIFAGGGGSPREGAKWTANRIRDLVEAAPKDHLVVIKEIGWPAGPPPQFDAEQQAEFWRAVLREPIASNVNICVFDGIKNVPWKNEPVTIRGDAVNVGPHWPVLFDANRQPTPFSSELIALWTKTRSAL